MIIEALKPYEQSVKSKIKKYLSNVLYVDDDFNLSLVRENKSKEKDEQITHDTEMEISNSDPFFDVIAEGHMIEEAESHSAVSTVVVQAEPEPKRVNVLEELLTQLQLNFGDVRLSPYKYIEEIEIEKLQDAIRLSHFTIIDWNLGEKVKATTVLKPIFEETNQIRLVVVYTNDFADAKSNFLKEIGEGITFVQGSDYEYAHHKSVILMICNKMTFNIQQIIDEFSSLLIQKFGYFSTVFFDAINQLNEKTAKLLGKFSQPFESLLMLQMHWSGFRYEDLPYTLFDFVHNHLSDEIGKVDEDIVHIIYADRIIKLYEMLNEEAGLFSKRIETATKELDGLYQDSEKKYLNALKKLDIRKYLKHLICKPDEWSDNLSLAISELQTDLLQKFLEIQVDNRALPEELKEDSREQIRNMLKGELSKQHKDMIKIWSSNVVPLLITLLSHQNFSEKVKDLIGLLKLSGYEEQNLTSLLDKNFIVKEGEIVPDKKLTINMFSSGDVIIDPTGDYYLCITPSCDAFRPDKVDYKLSLIKGTVLQKIPSRNGGINIKQSEHLTIIPDGKSENLICVKWDFVDQKTVDLINPYQHVWFRNCYRPYRLNKEYIQQITNKFTSYYLRVGVEELFLKQSPQIGKLFLRNG